MPALGYRYTPEQLQRSLAKRTRTILLLQKIADHTPPPAIPRHVVLHAVPTQARVDPEQMARECGLLYINGRVHTPPMPVVKGGAKWATS